MKYDDRYIVELSRAAIFDDAPFEPEESVDWEYIYNKSIEQNISGLLFTAVSKLSNEYKPDKDLYAKWQQKMLETIAVTSRQYNEFLKMSKVVSDAGIMMVGLKGCIIRNLYPVPELRTMGDFDVLVAENDLHQIKSIFTVNKYEIDKDLYGIIAKNDKAYWEIFTSLEEEFAVEACFYTKQLYERSFKLNKIFVPESTWFVAHMLIHTGKHYIEKGAGLRNLCDLALYIDKYKDSIDFELFEEICAIQNFSRIYKFVLNAIQDWYGIKLQTVKIEKRNTEEFVEYTLLNGIFGKNDNVLVHQFAKPQDDDISGARKLFFPSIKTLDYRYTYLKKFPFLLPVAWIHRFFSGVVRQRFSPITMIKDLKEAKKFSKERLKRLEDLGIKKEH